MTNMLDVHTCAIGRVDLIMAIVPLLHGELIQLTSDVVGGARVTIPVGVDTVVVDDVGLAILLFVVLVEAVPALSCLVALLAANLADGAVSTFATATATAVAL